MSPTEVEIGNMQSEYGGSIACNSETMKPHIIATPNYEKNNDRLFKYTHNLPSDNLSISQINTDNQNSQAKDPNIVNATKADNKKDHITIIDESIDHNTNNNNINQDNGFQSVSDLRVIDLDHDNTSFSEIQSSKRGAFTKFGGFDSNMSGSGGAKDAKRRRKYAYHFAKPKTKIQENMDQKNRPNTTFGQQNSDVFNIQEQIQQPQKQNFVNQEERQNSSEQPNSHIKEEETKSAIATTPVSNPISEKASFILSKIGERWKSLHVTLLKVQNNQPFGSDSKQQASSSSSSSVEDLRDMDFEANNLNVKEIQLLKTLSNNSQRASTKNVTSHNIQPDLYYQYTNRFTQEDHQVQENSHLLDESDVKKAIYMPNAQANRLEIEHDLGHYIHTQQEDQFQREYLQNLGNLDDSYYRIIDKDSIEVIEAHKDKFPCLNLRKQIRKLRVYINRIAIKIITNSIFETISILVIVCNSLFLALDDPLASEPPVYQNYSEVIFQVLYTIEMVLKISAMGFLFNEGAYIRDSWNILDFVIVVSGYIGMVLQGGGANLSVLRSFRVIRPLRTISSIQGLRVIVSALVASMPLLRDTILVLLFFFVIFAIAGVQLFSGILKNRCIAIETGIIDSGNVLCATEADCSDGQFCGKRNENPNYNTTNFDNILYALLLIFQTVTLEGWTNIMIYLEQCVASWVIAYFIPIVFIGAFFLVNLTLAVIKSKFTEEHKSKKTFKQKKKQIISKKKGIDDTSSEEETNNNVGQSVKTENQQNNQVSRIEDAYQKFIRELEQKDISPERKKALKDKFRIESLIQRLELQLQQREVKNQIEKKVIEISSPSLKGRKKRKKSINYETLLALKFEKPYDLDKIKIKDTINYSSLQLDLNRNTLSMNRQSNNYNHKVQQLLAIRPDLTIKEEIEESHECTIQNIPDNRNIDPDLIQKDNIPASRIGQINGRRSLSQNHNPDIDSSFHIKPWMNSDNEAQQQVMAYPQKQLNNLQMKGINAGIEKRQFIIDELIKAAAYEQLNRDFDIMGAIDIKNDGDDEMSDPLDSPDTLGVKSEDQISKYTQQDIKQKLSNFDRKSTITSTGSKITKKHTFQRKSSRTEININQNDTNANFQIPQESNHNLISPKEDLKKVKNIIRNYRRKTVVTRLPGTETHFDVVNSDFEGTKTNGDPSYSEKQNSPKKRPKGLKEKAKAFFQRLKSRKQVAPLNVRTESQKKLNAKELKMSISRLKSEFDLDKSEKSKIQNYQSIRTPSLGNIFGDKKKNYQFNIFNCNKKKPKKEIFHKDTIKYKKRAEEMKQKRNQFFAKSVKNIGKTQEEIKHEKKEKILKQRLIEIGGGFELPDPKDVSFNEQRKLYRTGSLKDSIGRQPLDEDFKDDNFQLFMKKIKEEVKNTNHEEEEIPDLEEALYCSKKKIAIKMKNYRFSSVHDVFEDRDQKQKEILSMHGQRVKPQSKNRQKRKLSKDEKAKQQESIKLEKNKGIKGFQKKVILEQKKYLHELMGGAEDRRESDENQEEVYKKLEAEYNINHRSNIHVTGTLSVVFDKPNHHTKMMNTNYYKQQSHQSVDSTYFGQRTTLNPRMKDVRIDVDNHFSKESKDSVLDQNSLESQEGITPQIRLQQKSQFFKSVEANQLQIITHNENKIQKSSSLRKSIQQQISSSSPKSAGLKKRNLLSVSPMARKNTQMMKKPSFEKKKTFRGSVRGGPTSQQQSSLIGSKMTTQQNQKKQEMEYQAMILQKPQIMTDKQIIKRLNNEVKKSKIFQTINFQSLPKEIKRKHGEFGYKRQKIIRNKKHKKDQRDKANTKPKQGLTIKDDEEVSDTSHEDQQYNDYFLDQEIDMLEAVSKAKTDATRRNKDRIEWSGQDIMNRFDPYKVRIALNELNRIRVWPEGYYGLFKRCRTVLKRIMKHWILENFMTLCVFANTIILAMDYYGIDDESSNLLQTFNTFFTIIFSCEMFLKIVAIGLTKWLQDKMNYMDGAVVIMSLVELAFLSGSGALSAFRSVRMFRTLRVLRVARLLRGLKSMMNIIAVIQRSISSFIYLGMLLFLFIFIYALLGMQLFGGQFGFLGDTNRYTFDTFNYAFVSSFVLLTMENWNNFLYCAMNSDVNKVITVFYFISCIFIGNFMLLNLFLAILLDAFTSVEEEDHETIEKKQQKDRERIVGLKTKQGQELIQGIDDVEGANLQSSPANNKKKKKRKQKKKNNETQSNNILDESIEIDYETLASKKEQNLEEKKKLFAEIECQNSLYMFSQSNKIRIIMFRIVTNQKFENSILVLIILSSVKLVYDTYLFNYPEDDIQNIISDKFDSIFTALFTCECVLKCISFGFVQDRNSYLRETWSQLDFFIVVTSLIDALFQNVNIPIIKILRLLRILRPLRFISHNSSMKTVVVALLDSMSGIFNVGIVVIAVFLMFSILGVNLYAGKLQYCTVETYYINTKEQCFRARGEWKTKTQNFDNVINGMITLFTVATLEGWPDLMYAYTDINGLEKGPKPGASLINAYFFICFVFIGSFFFMNLFVGVLFMNFEAAQKDEVAAMLLDREEIRWVDIMKMIVNTKPEIIKIPKNRISKCLYNFTKAESKFDFFIMICIILNMVQMAMTFEGMSYQYQKGLEYSNYFFTAVFVLEATLKMIANGKAYFIPNWHKFDLFVVLSSLLDIIMNQLSATSLKFLRVAPQLARVLRVLRVSRLFRLLNKYKGLQALLQTITFSLPSLMNVFALLMLVYFIFSVLGVFMFRSIIKGQIIDEEFMNFTNFGQAFIILIRMSTGEDWPTIMFDTMNTNSDCIDNETCGLSYAPVFFIPFIMICTYVMLNLFIMIIIQQFEMYYLPNDNILQTFREDLEQFKLVWHKYSKEHEGIKIRMSNLVDFFKQLKGNLGMHGLSDNDVLRSCVKMNMECDEDGFIYFNELLFKTMKRRYGQERTKKKILADLELKTLDRLQQIKEKMMASSRKKERFKAVTVNPFLAVMYKNMSFRAWKKLFEQNLGKRQEEQQFGLDRESSDEEINANVEDQDYEYITDQELSCPDDELEMFELSQLQELKMSQKLSPKGNLQRMNEHFQKSITQKSVKSQKSSNRNNSEDGFLKKFTIKLKHTQQINENIKSPQDNHNSKLNNAVSDESSSFSESDSDQPQPLNRRQPLQNDQFLSETDKKNQ